ncbi:MAG: hypothetical protein PGN20_15255 [Agrobacterium cavarae]
MSDVTQIVVIPFQQIKNSGVAPIERERRIIRTVEAAKRLAANMAARFAGVAAFEFVSEKETGELRSMKLLAEHGKIIDYSKEDM